MVLHSKSTVRDFILRLHDSFQSSSTDLEKAQLERKIRLLSLTTLAFQNIGRDLPYSAITDLLQVESSQVERWVIDGRYKPVRSVAISHYLRYSRTCGFGDREVVPDHPIIPYCSC